MILFSQFLPLSIYIYTLMLYSFLHNKGLCDKSRKDTMKLIGKFFGWKKWAVATVIFDFLFQVELSLVEMLFSAFWNLMLYDFKQRIMDQECCINRCSNVFIKTSVCMSPKAKIKSFLWSTVELYSISVSSAWENSPVFAFILLLHYSTCLTSLSLSFPLIPSG